MKRKGSSSYCVRHRAETHEDRRFFSAGMEFAEGAYACVLEAPSRGGPPPKHIAKRVWVGRVRCASAAVLLSYLRESGARVQWRQPWAIVHVDVTVGVRYFRAGMAVAWL